MTDGTDPKHVPLPWPRSGDRVFVSGEDAETDAWLKWCGDARWTAHAEGYKKAADLLVEQTKQDMVGQDYVIYPVGFLYRHSLELYLKSLIMVGQQLRGKNPRFPKHHELWELWQEARAVLEDTWPNDPKADLDNVEVRIRQFVDVDPFSEAFRYPSARNGKESLSQMTHINLRNLKEVVGRLIGLLDSAFWGMVEIVRIRREAEDYLA
jgi:hypothetical protein